MRSAAVIGLGLIGGSIARDLAAQGFRVTAEDRDPAALREAVAEGVVAGETAPSIDAEVVVIAVPVGTGVAVLRNVSQRVSADALVIDAGSTKAAIVAEAASLPIAERFAGCHPLAGDHRFGFAASRRGLFDGARVFVCPTPSTTTHTLARTATFWSLLGASIETIDATRHDRLMAVMSHLPQITSSALAGTMRESIASPRQLGRGGRDMTRLAGSSPRMWTDICLENADAIADALRGYGASLARFAGALETGDAEAVHAFFANGRAWMALEEDFAPES